jgi:hypothetical protein
MRAGHAVAVVAVLALTACGGGSLSKEEKVAEFAAMTDRLGARFNTAFLEPGAIPSSGQAVFEGYAGIVVETAPEELSLLGDARVVIDFGRDRVSGEINRVFGDQDGRLRNYDGSVSLINGVMGATRPNDFSFDYTGALTGQGNTILFDGSGDGVLKGTPIRGILAASDPGDTARVNGVETGVTLAISAEIE